MNPNPKLTANFWSKLFFWWLKPLFHPKKQENFETEKFFNVLLENSSQLLGDRIESAWNEEMRCKMEFEREPSFFKTLSKTFSRQFWCYGIHVFFICVILRGLQPYILGLLIQHFDSRSNSTIAQAYVYAFGFLIMIILQALVGHHSVVGRKVVGMEMSIACSSLIYRKLQRLSLANKYDTGKVINLLTNDVSKFENFSMFFHYIWVLPIQTIIMAYFMWDNIGLAPLVVGLIILTVQVIPVQGYLGKITAEVRNKVANKTDQRIRLMSEIISGIRTIKMSEIDAIARKLYLRGLSTAMSAFVESTSMFFLILTYVLLGNTLEASIVYSLAQYFGMIKTMMTVFYPLAVSSWAEAKVSIQRIQNFLLLDEVDPRVFKSQKEVACSLPSIKLTNLNISWKNDSTQSILFNFNLSISGAKLYVITGPVGSGKSTLLKTILRETKIQSGEIEVNGKVSYTSQEAWIFPGTVRDNILFGQSFNANKYEKVIEVCALGEDFVKLSNADLTIVGDQGSTLSGGQCARINLARSIYRDADIYLIDDVLTAVDVRVGKHIFDKCINGLLREKIRIFVTHDTHYVKEADEIIVINNGQLDFQGSYVDLTKTACSFHEWHPTLTDSGMANVPLLMEHKKSVRSNPQDLACVDSTGTEMEFIKSKSTENRKTFYSLFWRYFRAGGSISILLCLIFSFILAQASTCGYDYWLAHWIRKNGNESKTLFSSAENSLSEFFIFAFLLSSGIIMWTISSLLFYNICMNASKNLHDQMFSSLLKAPIQFFHLNTSGRILNRFSKDTGLVDETLPTVTLEALRVLLMILGVVIQVLIINWWSVLPVIVLGTACWKLKSIYLPTAQKMKRLENEVKSPVLSHAVSTISGLTLIRSAGVQIKTKAEFDRLQDFHTSVHYLNIVSSSAFGFWLDLISVILLVIITFSFILSKNNDTTAGIFGLAITQILMLYGSVQYGLRQTTEMMIQIISLERIFHFIKLEHEDDLKTKFDSKLLRNWPNEGHIVFNRLHLRYPNSEQLALENITLDIKPREKIGVVGRTGAGKTSLISVFFRFVNPEGVVYIDGIDIRSVSLRDIRSKISIIPQDPILFTASVRDNLDPLHKYCDEILWRALEDVGLKKLFEFLGSPIENQGSNLSSGQKQLLCLARAIISSNRILVLDEATSNIDPATDKIIQQIIKIKFLDWTVIKVAHKLNSVLDSDRILVMDQGKVVEFDKPCNLMRTIDGHFYNMINE